MLFMIAIPHDVFYITVKLCTLVLALLMWWFVVSAPTTPVT